MTADIVISRAGTYWRASAITHAGRLMVAEDQRFARSEAHLKSSEAIALCVELRAKGMLVELPDGFPAASDRSLLLRLFIAVLIILPGLWFLDLLLR